MPTLSEIRRRFQPTVPRLLQDPKRAVFDKMEALALDSQVAPYFPYTKDLPVLRGVQGVCQLSAQTRIGVVFSGGPAPGGHNVIAGIFDTLQKCGRERSLLGFIGGPEAIVTGSYKELKAPEIDHFRNQGGFDLLGSGRTKIDTPEQFKAVLNVVNKLKLDGLVIIGGDDSNTNAAFLAEYFLKEKAPTCVIGVPKTIDGDIQNPYVPISFGFDTASKIYSELIGNLARDTLSSLKYFHFVKLMGRTASHLTLECALKTRPNVTLIAEEKKSFAVIVNALADWVESRAKHPYGLVLIPEGLFEASLSQTLEKDSHGNINLSKIDTEQLLIEAVQKKLEARRYKGKFEPLAHFYGYEGRCGHPSNFDANYSYALGITSTLLILQKHTALMAYVGNLNHPPAEWTFGGVPLPPLLKMHERNGTLRPVIDKAIVNLQGKPFNVLQTNRPKWLEHSAYENPGPIQFAGDPQITDSIPLILQ